MITITS